MTYEVGDEVRTINGRVLVVAGVYPELADGHTLFLKSIRADYGGHVFMPEGRWRPEDVKIERRGTWAHLAARWKRMHG